MNEQRQQFKKRVFEGDKGRILLELSKTYKGDKRFQLNDRFKDDIQDQKLPEKFKKIIDNSILQKTHLQKTKPIKKEKPLIIRRFEPGTKQAAENIKKAEHHQKFIQKEKQKARIQQQRELKKKKLGIQKGIDKAKKAQLIIGQQLSKPIAERIKFSINVKGDRKQAFQPSQFKLFG